MEPSNDETVSAASAYTSEDITIERNQLIEVSNEEELFNLIGSMYNLTQGELEALPSAVSKSVEDVQAADVTRYAYVNWYQWSCGGGAYYLGGHFCWKNISYNYTTDNSGYLHSAEVESSSLTGLNYLQWDHHGGWGYRSGSGKVELHAHGVYTLGLQIYQLTVGARWNDTWIKTTSPPCNCH